MGVDSYAADPNTNCVKASGKGCVYVMTVSPDENTPRNIGCALNQVFSPPTSCAQRDNTPNPGKAVLGPATGANGGCSENGTAANGQTVTGTFIQPWDDVTPVTPAAGIGTTNQTIIQGQTGGPYMTLFSMDPATGYLTYQATIKVDDHQLYQRSEDPPRGGWS